MKKLFAILLVTILTSCGAALEPPKSNTDYKNIIGKPIKIGNLEIAQYDFPEKMNWEDAKKAYEALGDGWRLPTLDELDYLLQNRVAIGGFSDNNYWGSSNNDDVRMESAWGMDFVSGRQELFVKAKLLYIRAVRALEQSESEKNMIGKNIMGKSIKISYFEIAQYDFPDKKNWEDAKKACESLGDGWRLPTYNELNILYENQNKIGGFSESTYWSYSKPNNNYVPIQSFKNGTQSYNIIKQFNYVRAVRTLEQSESEKNIIGKSIKLVNGKLAQYDFPVKMNWEDAKKACEALGDGWRLPSLYELDYLYQNRVAIGGFASGYYWSSNEASPNVAGVQDFRSGFQGTSNKSDTLYVRAIGAF